MSRNIGHIQRDQRSYHNRVPINLKSIIFDAGYTLIYPDFQSLFAALPIARTPREQEIRNAGIAARTATDATSSSSSTREVFWPVFFESLLGDGLDAAHMDKLIKLIAQSTFWTQVVPGTDAILARLGEFYSLAVVSNADGALESTLRRLGLSRFFRCIIDSGQHTFKKPETGIFLKALDALCCSPSESLYVGDIYSIDYKGAREAGLRAVLLDGAGAYVGSALPRLDSLDELEHWITVHNV